jgi:ribosome biogenesis GTPase
MKLIQYGFNNSKDEKDHLLMDNQMIKGRVIGIEGTEAVVVTNDQDVRITATQVSLGDFVDLQKVEDVYQVKRVASPTTRLVRNKQTVATNFDTILLVTSPDEFEVSELEVNINQAWDTGAFPIIVLVNSSSLDLSKQLIQIRSVAACVDVFIVDPLSKDEKLIQMIKDGKTTLLMGSIPETKAYLINKLFDSHYNFNKSELYLINKKLLMNVDHGTSSSNQSVDSFEDVESLSQSCHFKDCTHQAEPGCHVLKSLNNGTLSQIRYDAYLKSHQVLEDEIVADEDSDDEDLYKAIERKKDKEKHKFTKKNSKED